MSDRFKFRAWDKINKEMIIPDGNGYFGSTNHLCFVVDGNGHPIYLDNCSIPGDIELMQCTGLKDKNDKLIYEGDILKDDLSCEEEPFYVMIGTVYWGKYGRWEIKNENSYANFHLQKHKSLEWCEYEIIGNIHENPELLNKTEE